MSDTEMADQDAPPPGLQCTCAACTMQSTSSGSRKKRYNPPRADKDTFETQQEFLDSLQTVPLHEVIEHDPKCVICRKPYDEPPDPGFNNSEEPVRLRCGHAFGNKCLASVFALPTETTVNLKPLSFGPMSRGADLGKRLRAYVNEYAKDYGDMFQAMQNLVDESATTRATRLILGEHWCEALTHARDTSRELATITIMENAIVLDHTPLTRKKHNSEAFEVIQPHQSTASANLTSTLYEQIWAIDGLSTVPGANIPQILSTQGTLNTNWKESLLQCSQLDDEDQKVMSQQWGQFLSQKTNLDKLVALKHDKPTNSSAEPFTVKESAQNAKQTINFETPQVNENPKIAAHSPNEAAEARIRMEAAERQKKAVEVIERLKRENRKLLARILTAILAEYDSLEDKHDTLLKGDYRIGIVALDNHIGEHHKSSYKIDQPYLLGLFQGNDSDTEAMGLEATTFVINRHFCNSCNNKMGATTSLASITSISWTAADKGPDGCPICHKVLFKRDKKKLRACQISGSWAASIFEN
ncbi:hypothetical protein ACN47E_010210 [Coniothyrium glycines]